MISTSVVAIRSPVRVTGGSLETFRFPRLGSGCSRTQIRLPRVKPRQSPRSVRMSGGVESVTTQQSESVQSAGSESKAVNVIIKGKVQGVFYRNWTVENAKKLNLNGWVRNCRDGTVEAVFSGTSSAVDDMVQKCHSGPSSARVSGVNISKWDNEVP